MFRFLDKWEFFLARMASYSPSQEAPTDCKGKNLLILPTLHAGKGFYKKLALSLENQGFQVAILSTLRNPDSLDEAVDHVAKQIVDATDDLTLVAHGTGGLLSLILPDKARRMTRRLITLGTPFHGSKTFHGSNHSYWDFESEWVKHNYKNALFFPMFQPLATIEDFSFKPTEATTFGQGRDLWFDIPGNYNLVKRTENLRTILEFLGTPKQETKSGKVSPLPYKKVEVDFSKFQPKKSKEKKNPSPSAKKKSPAKKKKGKA